MQRTIYNTPIVKQICKGIALVGLKIAGWKLEGRPPGEKKYVLVAVPHTSNWDFPITLSMAFVFGFDIYWMGKHTLFWGPMGPIMKWLGGIPIQRSKANNIVQQTIDAFNSRDSLVVAVPPEGTRSKVTQWKTGFYYIATGANVPIGMGYLDYEKKIGGFGPTFYPTGDIDADIAKMQLFYANISGKYKDK